MDPDGSQPGLRSTALDDIPTPDFADVVIVAIPGAAPVETDPREWARRVFDVRTVPWWVKALLVVRQGVVGLLGIPRADQSVFTVSRVVGEEAVIAADDRHLDFRIAVGIDGRRRLLRITTVVRFHGWRGRLYFVPVSVLHGPVTRAMASAAVKCAMRA